MITGSVAPQLHTQTVEEPVSRSKPVLRVVAPPEAPASRGPGRQASLFGPQVVAPKTATTRKHHAVTRTRERSASTVREFQTNFDFEYSEDTPAPSICRDAPVAGFRERAISAAIDLSLSFGGTLAFITTLQVLGTPIDLGDRTWLFYLGSALVILFFYRLLFSVGETDTPGMRFMGLYLTNFDGHRPSRRQRIQRLGGACISVVAAGLGLLWSLFDEHRLSWHDHISETFVTTQPPR